MAAIQRTIEADLQRLLRDTQHTIVSAAPHEHILVLSALLGIASLVSDQVQPEPAAVPWMSAEEATRRLWQAEFLKNGYRGFTSFLLRIVGPNWLPSFSSAQQRRSFDAFFLSPAVPRAQAITALNAVLDAGASPNATTSR